MGAYRSFESIINDIKRLRSEGWSYQAIGDAYGVNKGIIWKMENEHYEPQDLSLRKILLLPPLAEVEFIEHLSLNGHTVQIQAHHIRRCACGQYFVPNTAKRQKCFTCEPFRKRII